MLQLKCSYCGSPSYIIKESKKHIIRAIARYRLNIRRPICHKCWHMILNGTLPCDATPTDIQVRSVTKVCDDAIKTFNSSTELNDVLTVASSVDELWKLRQVAEADFNHKANEAAKSAERLSWLTNLILSAQQSVENKIKSSYETCRLVANRHITNSEVRDRIFQRDGYKCRECGSNEFLTVDHIIPVILGGNNDDSNLQCLCLRCNCKKGGRN